MRIGFALLGLCLLAACASPAPGEKHPYDGYFDHQPLALPQTEDVQRGLHR